VTQLFHFSEDPSIQLFRPHVAATSRETEAYVWAIDEAHAFMYFAPRDCPRACFWPCDSTTPEDRDRWFGTVQARAVMAIESGWLERLRRAKLFRYTLPPEAFWLHDATAGHWVAQTEVEPLRAEPVGDLLSAIANEGVELRITPALAPLWNAVIRSSLAFSGTRLRNAHDFDQIVPP
jgi:hypothetical protein